MGGYTGRFWQHDLFQTHWTNIENGGEQGPAATDYFDLPLRPFGVSPSSETISAASVPLTTSIIPSPGSPGIAPNVTSTIDVHGNYDVAAGVTEFGVGLANQQFPAFGGADVLIYDDTFQTMLTNDGTLWNRQSGQDYSIGVFAQSFVQNNGEIVAELNGADSGFAAYGVYEGGGDLNNSGKIYAFSNLGVAAGVYGANADTINDGLIAAHSDQGTAIGVLREDRGGGVNHADGTIMAEGPQAIGVSLGPYGHGDSSGNPDDTSPAVDNAGLIEAVSTDPQFASVGIYAGGQEGFELNFINSGTIHADYAIYIGLDSFTENPYTQESVTNKAGGEIDGVIYLANGDDQIVNQGTINGIADMGGGNDLVDNTAGTINGYTDLGIGDDTYLGGAGDDDVLGGRGNDNLSGGAGQDLLLGGYGDDTLDGGSGSDGLYGEYGNDTITAGKGDFVNAGPGDDRIILTDFGGSNGIQGGTGFDTLVLADGTRILDLKLALADGTISGIDDITLGNGNGLVVRPADVLKLSDANKLEIQGTSSNQVYLLNGWSETGDQIIGGVTYHAYSAGSSQLLLQDGIVATIQSAAPAGAVGFDPAPDILPPVPNPIFLANDVTVVDGYDNLYPLTIFANETWESDNGSPVIFNEISLTNYGTIQSITSAHPAMAVTGDGLFVNYGHVVATTQAPFAVNAAAFSGGGAIHNFGTIDVFSAAGDAIGIQSSAPDDVITNDGTITVESDAVSNNPLGHLATGVHLRNPSMVNNGTIEVTGAGAVAVFMEVPSLKLTNTGMITATSTQGYESVALLGGYELDNSGTIKAGIAVESDFFSNFDVQNTGTIQGDFLGNTARFDPITHYDDTIVNSGTIIGTIYFGLDEDTYDGRNGHLTGEVFGQDGDDTLLGGAGNDVFDGGAGNDTLNGGGGSDTASYEDATGGVNVNLAISGAQAVGGGAGTDTLISIENLTGSNFNDALHGNNANNILSGLGGDDVFYMGDGGIDTALGGDGNDTFFFIATLTAADTIDGGTGTDTLWLNGDYAGANAVVFAPTTMVNVENISLIAGHSYNLTLNDANVAAGQTLTVDGHALGATDALTFNGSQETDGKFVLLGGAGNDFFVGGAGDDTLNGGGGSDTVSYAAATAGVAIDLSISTAQAVGGGQGSDTLISIENIIGSNFDDTLASNSSDNILNGGGGSDTASYEDATGGVTVNLAISGAQAVGGGAGTDTLISIENLMGSNFNDALHGNSANNILSGLGGDDVFYMGDGGIDTALGGDGNDTFFFIATLTAADTIDGGAGADVIWLNGDYTGANAVVFAPTTMVNVENISVVAGHSYNLTLNDANVAAGQTLTVNASALGSADSLTFDGSHELDGKFVLLGGAGNDVLIGGAGNDMLVGGAGDDTLNGGGGIDTASYASATAGVNVNLSNSTAQAVGAGLGNDTLISIESVTGSNFNDVLRGSGANNVLSGGGDNDTFDLSDGGNDTVLGGDGNDVMNFGAALTAIDKIDGGAGSDTVTLNGDYSAGLKFGVQTMINVETVSLAAGHSYKLTMNNGNVAAGQTLTVTGTALGAGDTFHFDGSYETDGNFIIYGGAGDDVLTGGAGNDALYGAQGNDTLRGGLGADHMTGGAGNDIFVYKNAAESTGSNYDTITGFGFLNADKIDLKFKVATIDTAVATGALSTASFDTDLAASIDSAHLGKHSAVLFTPDSGDLAGKTFLVIDANGVKGYQAGSDFVIQLDQPNHTTSIDVTDFI